MLAALVVIALVKPAGAQSPPDRGFLAGKKFDLKARPLGSRMAIPISAAFGNGPALTMSPNHRSAGTA
jgi:hypothetical protein